jgi:tRNA-splicing ligase RtcB
LVWIGVHFGSRGLEHKITTKHLEWSGAEDGMEVEPAVVRADRNIGRSYIAGIELGGLYAYVGREWVVERVRQIIGAAVTESVHNHHNFARRETHGDRDLRSWARVPPLPSRASTASWAVRWVMMP